MEIHGVDIAGGHGRKLEAFARRVGAGKIETHVVAHDESHYRQCNILGGADADPHHNRRQRFQQMDGVTGEVEHRDPDDLRAAISKTMVDVRNSVNYFRRFHWSARDALSVPMEGSEVSAVFLIHRSEIPI